MDLDHIDARLVTALQADGRASYEALARTVGLSRIAARNRVNRLIDSGAVEVMTVVHPAARGLNAYGHMALTVEGPALPVAEAVARLSECPLVSVVGGHYAVIAEVRTADVETLRTRIQQVRAIDGVRHVSSCLYTERLKDRHSGRRTAGPTAPVELDNTDHALIEALGENGRASFAELGDRVRLSASSARARVLRLLDEGVLHVGATVQLGALGLGHMCGFGIAAGDVGSDGGLERLAALSSVHYLTECLGVWDAIGTLLCTSQDEVASALDEVRATTGIRQVDAWAHLRIVKENYRAPGPSELAAPSP